MIGALAGLVAGLALTLAQLLARLSAEQGFAAVQAVPMRLREQILGALNLFSRSANAIPADVTAIAQSFANVATISILQIRALRHSEMVTEQLQTALNSRVLIEQAKGILADVGRSPSPRHSR